MRNNFLIGFVFFTFSSNLFAQADSNKTIVGAIEEVLVGEDQLPFKARVDTGAQTSSIHAKNIDMDLLGDPQGKPIIFYIENKHGGSSKIETIVDSITTIKTAEGSEERFKIPLKIKWNNSIKTILLTLNDRTDMTYGLLLGRNWLQGDFIVDVDLNNED